MRRFSAKWGNQSEKNDANIAWNYLIKPLLYIHDDKEKTFFALSKAV